MRERLEYIDFAKGFAILAIALYHYARLSALPGSLLRLAGFGGAGVHLFFFLSGFGLIMARPVATSVFYGRRLLKVFFPYFLFITVSVFALGLLTGSYDWYAWGGHILGYKMFDSSIMGSFGGHLWFMSSLLQLYFIFPLLVLVRRGKVGQRVLPFVACVFSVCFWLLLWSTGKHETASWSRFFLQYFWEFCLGMVVADAVAAGRGRFWEMGLARVAVIFFVSATAMFLLATWFGEVGRLFNDVFAMLAIVSASVLAYQGLRVVLPCAVGWVSWLGIMSLYIYLTHLFAEPFLRSWLDVEHGPLPWLALAAMPFLALLSAWLLAKASSAIIKLFSKQQAC